MKAFVIDTNVILSEPDSIFNFDDNLVVVTMSVLEEIDKVKTKNEEVGRFARTFSRNLDSLIDKNKLNITSEQLVIVPINDKGGRLLLLDDSTLNDKSNKKVDDLLIKVTQYLTTEYKYQATLVTNDINLKLKCRLLMVPVEQYKNNMTQISFSPIPTLYVDDRIIDSFYHNADFVYYSDLYNIVVGEYYKLSGYDPHKNVLCRATLYNDKKCLVKIDDKRIVSNIRAKNYEQCCLVNALTSPNIDLVVCNGIAGTGKTLLSIAAGLEGIDNKTYDKMLILKSIMPFGRDIGYLKGDLKEKMKAWLMPFYDNLEYIFDGYGGVGVYDHLINSGFIEIDALTYIRGRSLPNRFIIIDEVQNLTQKEIKTIVTRVGEGSKIVLLGDVQQIDHPYLTQHSNALAYVMDKMSGLPNVAVLNLYKSERSRVANQALEKL